MDALNAKEVNEEIDDDGDEDEEEEVERDFSSPPLPSPVLSFSRSPHLPSRLSHPSPFDSKA